MRAALVDTSIFVEYFRAKYPKPGKDVEQRNNDFFSALDIPYVCPTVIQEVMQGFLKHEWQKADTDLRSYDVVIIDPVDAVIQAALIYRKLKSTGYTMKNGNDCLIAVHAIASNLPVLTLDGDYNEISKYYPLKVIQAKA